MTTILILLSGMSNRFMTQNKQSILSSGSRFKFPDDDHDHLVGSPLYSIPTIDIWMSVMIPDDRETERQQCTNDHPDPTSFYQRIINQESGTRWATPALDLLPKLCLPFACFVLFGNFHNSNNLNSTFHSI